LKTLRLISENRNHLLSLGHFIANHKRAVARQAKDEGLSDARDNCLFNSGHFVAERKRVARFDAAR